MLFTFSIIGRALLITYLLLCAAHAESLPDQSEEAIDLATAIQLALEHNPEFHASAYEIQAAEAGLAQSQKWRNPALEITVEDIGKSRQSHTLQLAQPFELGGKRTVRVDQAKVALNIARLDRALKESEIRSLVTLAYRNAVLAQRKLVLARDSLNLAQQFADGTEKRLRAGKIPPLEADRARLAATTARVEKDQAERGYQVALQKLAAFWGGDSKLTILNELPATIQVPSWESTKTRLLTGLPNQRSRANIAVYQAITAVEKSRRIPDITLSAGVKHDREFGDTGSVFGISIPIPLFDRNQGAIAQAQAKLTKSEIAAQAEELGRETEAFALYQKLHAAGAEIFTLREEALPTAERALSAARKGYEYGKFGFLEVLDAQRALFSTRALFLQSLADAFKTQAELELLIGEPLGNLLPPNNDQGSVK